MLQPKTVTLAQIGYRIRGTAAIKLWGGQMGTIEMDPEFLPLKKLSPDNLKRLINDGQFGCESVINAELEIFDVYGTQDLLGSFELWDRCISVTHLRNLYCKGI